MGRRAEEGLRGRRSSTPPATRRRRTTTAATSTTGELQGLSEALLELQQLTERLRRECPWDREQTARTIVPHTVEEAYEVADAALAGDDAKLLDELGDLLFQVVLPRAAAARRGRGDLERRRARRARQARPPASARVRRRRGADTAGRVRENWEKIKREQRAARAIFHDVAEALPALLYARKVQRRARAVGFEYPDLEGALADLDDELRELRGRGGGRRAGARERARPAVAPSSATSSSPPSTSRGSSTSTRSSRCALAARASSSASTTPSCSPPPRGENWSELPLEEQDRYFDHAKETTR